MAQWTRVCPLSELPAGARRMAEVDGVAVVVFNIGGRLHALEDVCTHDGGDLAGGALDGHEIICPRHGARFDVRTGEVKAPPAYEAAAILAVRTAQGWVEVRDERWD